MTRKRTGLMTNNRGVAICCVARRVVLSSSMAQTDAVWCGVVCGGFFLNSVFGPGRVMRMNTVAGSDG